MKVSDIMTRHPHTLQADASLASAVEIMVGYKIRHLPIVEKGKVLGIISDRDLKMALGPDSAGMELGAVDPRYVDGSVEWFMSDGIVTIDAGASVDEAAKLFIERKFGAIPVLDDGQLVGIVSVLDVLKAALPLLQA